MNKLNSIINLIRFKNLLIIALIQTAIKFFLINTYLNNFALSNSDFSIYLFSLLTIIASGYIINDIYDLEIDKINKPTTRIIEKKITKELAMKIYYILNLIGITSGFYAAYKVNRWWFGLIFVFFALSLLRYSKNYKTTFLIGNLQIAFLTALSILAIALFDLVPVGITYENASRTIFNIIFIYAGFSFIITLIREIIKDLEDIKGDKEIGSNTLAISYGIKKTKKITKFLILIPICGIAYFQYLQYNVLNINFSVENLIAVLYTLFIQALLIALIIKINISETKKAFHFASGLCKIIMLLGILSIPLFYLLHQN